MAQMVFLDHPAADVLEATLSADILQWLQIVSKMAVYLASDN